MSTMDMKKLEEISNSILNDTTPVDEQPKAPTSSPTKMHEISHIEVDDDYVSQIMGESKITKPTPAKVSEDKLSEVEQLEERMTDLIKNLKTLLGEAKQVMTEMTTVGMIGTNQKFTLNKPKKKKNGSSKANQRNASQLG